MFICLGELDFDGGSFSNNGTGKVEFYMMGGNGDDLTFDPGSGNIGDPDASERLLFYVQGPKTVFFANGANGQDVYAYVFAPESLIDMQNGQTTLYGSVYGQEVHMSSNVSIEYQGGDAVTETLYYTMQIDYWE